MGRGREVEDVEEEDVRGWVVGRGREWKEVLWDVFLSCGRMGKGREGIDIHR